jgi:hypothetical protein
MTPNEKAVAEVLAAYNVALNPMSGDWRLGKKVPKLPVNLASSA